MGLYRFRLEAQDGSGHFREGTTEAESKDQAEIQLMLKEYTWAAYRLDDERLAVVCEENEIEPVRKEDGTLDTDATLDQLPQVHDLDATEEEKATFRALSNQTRRWLNLHRQKEPYKLVKLEEVGG